MRGQTRDGVSWEGGEGNSGCGTIGPMAGCAGTDQRFAAWRFTVARDRDMYLIARINFENDLVVGQVGLANQVEEFARRNAIHAHVSSAPIFVRGVIGALLGDRAVDQWRAIGAGYDHRPCDTPPE